MKNKHQKGYVIDASIVIKWISNNNELFVEEAMSIFEACLSQKLILICPEFLRLEVANILLKKKGLSCLLVNRFLELTDEIGIRWIELSGNLIVYAVELAHQNNLSVYDALYLAVSQQSGFPLLSADEKHHGRLKEVMLLSKFRK